MNLDITLVISFIDVPAERRTPVIIFQQFDFKAELEAL